MGTGSLSSKGHEFKPGTRVRILDGPFNDFRGKITEVDPSREHVKVAVNFFGREVITELSFTQIVQE